MKPYISQGYKSIGPRVVNIEISLSFDDGQNAEMDSVMINVRETTCHVRERIVHVCETPQTYVRIPVIRNRSYWIDQE